MPNCTYHQLQTPAGPEYNESIAGVPKECRKSIGAKLQPNYRSARAAPAKHVVVPEKALEKYARSLTELLGVREEGLEEFMRIEKGALEEC